MGDGVSELFGVGLVIEIGRPFPNIRVDISLVCGCLTVITVIVIRLLSFLYCARVTIYLLR